MLLRKLEVGLVGVSHVIVDEVHERDINVSVCVTVCLSSLMVVMPQCTVHVGNSSGDWSFQ